MNFLQIIHFNLETFYNLCFIFPGGLLEFLSLLSLRQVSLFSIKEINDLNKSCVSICLHVSRCVHVCVYAHLCTYLTTSVYTII